MIVARLAAGSPADASHIGANWGGTVTSVTESEPEGTWIARYRDHTQQRQYQALGPADDVREANGASVLSFEQAQERAREWFAQIESGGSDPRRRGAYTVADCMADYLAWAKLHRKSHRHLEVYIRAYILPKLGPADTAKLTTAMLREWQNGIASEPPRLRTRRGGVQRYRNEGTNAAEAERKRKLRANRHLVILRAALNRAWREGRIARAEPWMRLAPFQAVERQRTRFLNQDEARRLMNACPSDLRRLVQLALLTGARFAELCAFDVSDFQADSGTLFVRDSKSGKSRHIVLNEEGVALCRTLAVGRSLGEPLVVKSDRSRWKRDHQFRPFKAAVKNARIDPAFTFHGLRHTWASLTVMAGAPLVVVANTLGHRDTAMVEAHYGHLAPSYVAETIRAKAPVYGLDSDATAVSALIAK